MSNNEEYPEEIYGLWRRSTATTEDPEFVYDLGFERGVKHALAGTGHWHNLTRAIVDGEPIDFEKLDGRKVRLTKSQAVLEDVLERDGENPADSFDGWYCSVFGYFTQAWRGAHDWTLWLDGEIPMRKQTAEELEPGTEFYGIPPSGTKFKLLRTATGLLHLSDYQMAQISPSHFEVVEVLGMYGQKESE